MRLSDTPLLSENVIQTRVVELAARISGDYVGRDLLLLPVLKGGLLFAADLMRRLTVPVAIDFIRARSYAGHLSKGTVEFTLLPELSLAGKDVVIVEDILDTGRTTAAIFDRIASAQARSVALCVLLDKPAGRVVPMEAAYTGFTIDDHFVVGYGLDYDEAYRHLPAVYTLVPDDAP